MPRMFAVHAVRIKPNTRDARHNHLIYTDKFINLDGEVLDWLGIMQKEIQSSHAAPDWRALVMSPPGSERDQ